MDVWRTDVGASSYFGDHLDAAIGMPTEVLVDVGDLLERDAEHVEECLNDRVEIVFTFDSNEENVQGLRESEHEDEKDQEEPEKIAANHRVDHHHERAGRPETPGGQRARTIE